MQQIYSEIISLFNKYETNKTPISDFGHSHNFSMIEHTNENEYYRSIKKDGEYTIILSIESFEHDRTFQMRPDTYHNYAYLYKNDELISSNSYMYEE